jgi:hypothetical protein
MVAPPDASVAQAQPTPHSGHAVAMVRAAVSRGARPAQIAAIVRDSREAPEPVLAWLHTVVGNHFVQEVVAAMQSAPAGDQAPAGGLPAALRGKLERGLGADFGNVRIHADSARADEVGARAFAQGDDVHFAPGEYQPDTSSGQALIGHELTHVVQQREGRVAETVQAKGGPLNTDPALEAEADQRGAAAVEGGVTEADAVFEAPARARGTAASGGVIQRVEKAAVEQLVIDDESQNRTGQAGAGLNGLRNYIKRRTRDNDDLRTRCLHLLDDDGRMGLIAWPVSFADIQARLWKVVHAEQLPAALEKALVTVSDTIGELAGAGQVSREQLGQLLVRYGYEAVEHACKTPSHEPLEARLDQEARTRAQPVDLQALKLGGELPNYQSAPHDPNVLESSQRVKTTKQMHSPNEYIHRHFTPATMKFLFDNQDVAIHVLEGTVTDLLHFAKAGGYTDLNPLADNANTDFAKYIARDPQSGKTALLVLAPNGPAYRSEVLAHFTHYEHDKQTLPPERIQLHALPTTRTEQEFSSVVGQVGNVSAVVLGKVDDLRKELALRNVYPSQVIRSTTPPVFGLIYEVPVNGRVERILSINIEPGLYASRAGAFLHALLQHSEAPRALLFAGTAGALDPSWQVGDLVVPATIRQIDSIIGSEPMKIDNHAHEGFTLDSESTSTTTGTVRMGASHGSVESILVEDDQWLNVQRDQGVQVVEQEVASLVRAARANNRELAWYVFFTVSDIVGVESFANEGEMQRLQPPVKPGAALCRGLELLLGTDKIMAPEAPHPKGSLQLQLGAEQLKSTLGGLQKMHRDLLGRYQYAKQMSTNSQHPQQKEFEQTAKELPAVIARVAGQIAQVEQLIALKPRLLELTSQLVGLIDRLHPKQAKVITSLVMDGLIEGTQPAEDQRHDEELARVNSLQPQGPSKKKSKEPEPTYTESPDVDLDALALTRFVQVLQEHGILLDDLMQSSSELSKSSGGKQDNI